MKLVRLTQGKSGKHHYLNTDHVRSVTETDGGTLITFGAGKTLIVNESLTDTVDAIQAVKS